MVASNWPVRRAASAEATLARIVPATVGLAVTAGGAGVGEGWGMLVATAGGWALAAVGLAAVGLAAVGLAAGSAPCEEPVSASGEGVSSLVSGSTSVTRVGVGF